jgi:hypothetical protein
MSTRSERKSADKSAFSVIALANQFLHEAEKLGLTPTQLQRLRESREGMKEFVELAKKAEEDHNQRVADLQHERECAVDIDGIHYHVVVVSLTNAECTRDSTLSEVLQYAKRHDLVQLSPVAYEKAQSVVASISCSGLWVAGVESKGSLQGWWRTDDGRVRSTLYLTQLDMKLSKLPSELLGFLFLMDCSGCDYEDGIAPRE